MKVLIKSENEVSDLWKYFKFAREDSDALEFVPLLLFELLPVLHELVEKMVNDVRLEDLDAQRVRQVLSVTLDLHVESQYRRIPAGK